MILDVREDLKKVQRAKRIEDEGEGRGEESAVFVACLGVGDLGKFRGSFFLQSNVDDPFSCLPTRIA